MLRIADACLQATHEHGDIGSLTAAVGVKFVKDDEFESVAVLKNLAIKLILPGHQEFEHHEVCQ